MSRLTKLTPLLAVVSSAALAQGTFLADQQAGTDGNYGELPFGLISGTAQSFTPSLPGVAFINLYFFDASPQNTSPSTLYVNLRQDSITGTILGTSSPITLPATGGGVLTFIFPTTVSVAPGTTYYLEPKIQSGALSFETTGSRLFNYSGGQAYSQGSPFTGADLWFREGIFVPEPSAFALFVLAAVAVAFARHSKAR